MVGRYRLATTERLACKRGKGQAGAQAEETDAIKNQKAEKKDGK